MDRKAIEAVQKRQFKRGKGAGFDEYDDMFELRKRRRKQEDEDASGLKHEDDAGRPAMDLSDTSDTETTLMENMQKRTMMRDLEHVRLYPYTFLLLSWFHLSSFFPFGIF